MRYIKNLSHTRFSFRIWWFFVIAKYVLSKMRMDLKEKYGITEFQLEAFNPTHLAPWCSIRLLNFFNGYFLHNIIKSVFLVKFK